LKKEIREYFLLSSRGQNDKKETIKTIYFWGWTPSVLSHDEMRQILEWFPFYNKIDTEITMEMNPEDVTAEYIEWVLALGINRISLGVQTLNEASLTEIHRSDRETIFRALASVDEASISLNIDFILGLPFVQPWETLAGIKELHERFPYITHTSVYMLEDEKYPKHWKENSITEIEMQSEFLAIMDYLGSIGWHHYEFSNWARPGYESVHNQAYWDHSETRGFGLSAASFELWKRWSNASSFTGYYAGRTENEEMLTPDQIEIEEMMFWLRRDGWICDKKTIKVDALISDWLIEIHENRIKPTKTWIFLLDHILSELM
jgi:oxygen-independent coproporphyrinogen-3 oxidase